MCLLIYAKSLLIKSCNQFDILFLLFFRESKTKKTEQKKTKRIMLKKKVNVKKRKKVNANFCVNNEM